LEGEIDGRILLLTKIKKFDKMKSKEKNLKNLSLAELLLFLFLRKTAYPLSINTQLKEK